MKKLDKQIKGKGEVKGYDFTQVAESQYGYIYKKEHKEHGIVSFEVFKKVIVDTIDWETKQPTGTKESYPSSAIFGLTAFNVKTIQDAVAKLDDIGISCKQKAALKSNLV
jgi:hypothetical protein